MTAMALSDGPEGREPIFRELTEREIAAVVGGAIPLIIIVAAIIGIAVALIVAIVVIALVIQINWISANIYVEFRRNEGGELEADCVAFSRPWFNPCAE